MIFIVYRNIIYVDILHGLITNVSNYSIFNMSNIVNIRGVNITPC